MARTKRSNKLWRRSSMPSPCCSFLLQDLLHNQLVEEEATSGAESPAAGAASPASGGGSKGGGRRKLASLRAKLQWWQRQQKGRQPQQEDEGEAVRMGKPGEGGAGKRGDGAAEEGAAEGGECAAWERSFAGLGETAQDSCWRPAHRFEALGSSAHTNLAFGGLFCWGRAQVDTQERHMQATALSRARHQVPPARPPARRGCRWRARAP